MLFYLGTIIALNVDLNVDILSAYIIDSDIWTARGKGQGPSRYPVCQSVIHRKDTPNTHIMILCEITAHLLSCTQTHNQARTHSHTHTLALPYIHAHRNTSTLLHLAGHLADCFEYASYRIFKC